MHDGAAAQPNGHPSSRLLLVTALALTIVSLLGFAALGRPPGAGEDGAAVAQWFRVNRDGVRWFVWAGTATIPVLALLIALLRRPLPAPHRDVFLIGGIAIVVASAVQSWTWGGLALHADSLEPATARTVLDVALFFGPVLTGACITMIAPPTLLALRRQAGLPRWLGVLGAATVAEQALETVTIFGSTGFTEPGGAMNMQLGGGLVGAWLLSFAVWSALRRA